MKISKKRDEVVQVQAKLLKNVQRSESLICRGGGDKQSYFNYVAGILRVEKMT